MHTIHLDKFIGNIITQQTLAAPRRDVFCSFGRRLYIRFICSYNIIGETTKFFSIYLNRNNTSYITSKPLKHLPWICNLRYHFNAVSILVCIKFIQRSTASDFSLQTCLYKFFMLTKRYNYTDTLRLKRCFHVAFLEIIERRSPCMIDKLFRT